MPNPTHPFPTGGDGDAEARIRRRMEEDGAPELLIESFLRGYRVLRAGTSMHLGHDAIDSVESLPDTSALARHRAAGMEAMRAAVILKLNGGLGTSMGLDRAKSLLPARGRRTFLELIIQQALSLRRECGAGIPLLFMNSFRTEADTRTALSVHHGLEIPGLPLTFLQNRVPRIAAHTLLPYENPSHPEQGWCPPGHGELFIVLQSSGLLTRLLEQGYRYAFISNADNLGATLDPCLLGYFASRSAPFLMEVSLRTKADRKGGHLARRRDDGGWILREAAQCPPGEREEFGDINRYRFFNTNNLWLDLQRVDQELRRRGGQLDLPVMCTERRADSCDPNSPKVYQLETAVGAAISALPGAEALAVPRDRFAPVKTTEDLLRLWSDLYLEDGPAVRPNPARKGPLPEIHLDPQWFGTLTRFQTHFPHGAPSLIACESLHIEGDVKFGAGVRVVGHVHITHPGPGTRVIPDGAVLNG